MNLDQKSSNISIFFRISSTEISKCLYKIADFTKGVTVTINLFASQIMTSKFALKTSFAINKIHVSSDMSKFAQNFLIAGFKIQKGFL